MVDGSAFGGGVAGGAGENAENVESPCRNERVRVAAPAALNTAAIFFRSLLPLSWTIYIILKQKLIGLIE